MKATGYLIFESCEEFEQGLALRTDDKYPPNGILDWGHPVTMFNTRKDAQDAINRTEHYRLAFGFTTMPEKKSCKIIPVCAVKTSATTTEIKE